ncbi:hypothetical protein JOB18_030333 [Solea senegalensis]|uniref:Uncharacterized protein n=1 Tax=Solea senegalensis TaxID=28829 RepID=A0AAV6SH24_SOLSE|nr:hypothetical protein JOB18_030333 [Solea senegalensis]
MQSGGPGVRVYSAECERLLPCFCSVTAFPSRSSLLVPKLATARASSPPEAINFHTELTHIHLHLVCTDLHM